MPKTSNSQIAPFPLQEKISRGQVLSLPALKKTEKKLKDGKSPKINLYIP